MKRGLLAVLLMLPLMLMGCQGLDAGAGDASALPAIKMYNSALSVGEYEVDVTPQGEMLVSERRGTTDTAVQNSKMQLTAQQIQSLQKAFKGWKKLNPDNPGEWSNVVVITYDGYKVTAHDLTQVPPQFTTAMATLVNLARQTVGSPAPAPGSQAAPANPPAPGGAAAPMPALAPRN